MLLKHELRNAHHFDISNNPTFTGSISQQSKPTKQRISLNTLKAHLPHPRELSSFTT